MPKYDYGENIKITNLCSKNNVFYINIKQKP
jgi:hypothetical protein